MLRDYYSIIREALKSNRVKGNGSYYEAHHIVPRSFNKKSSTVLLLPEEHYRCHKLLAEIFKHHPIYGKKMLWAFHRIAYDKKTKLTEEEYGQARRILMTLWTRKQTAEHSAKIAAARTGTKTIVHSITKKIKYCSAEELPSYLDQGWENTNLSKGRKDQLSKEGKQKLVEARRRDQIGKVGDQAKASKGWVVCEYEDGRKVEASNAYQLSSTIKISPATVSDRLTTHPGLLKKGYMIYYKDKRHEKKID